MDRELAVLEPEFFDLAEELTGDLHPVAQEAEGGDGGGAKGAKSGLGVGSPDSKKEVGHNIAKPKDSVAQGWHLVVGTKKATANHDVITTSKLPVGTDDVMGGMLTVGVKGDEGGKAVAFGILDAGGQGRAESAVAAVGEGDVGIILGNLARIVTGAVVDHDDLNWQGQLRDDLTDRGDGLCKNTGFVVGRDDDREFIWHK